LHQRLENRIEGALAVNGKGCAVLPRRGKPSGLDQRRQQVASREIGCRFRDLETSGGFERRPEEARIWQLLLVYWPIRNKVWLLQPTEEVEMRRTLVLLMALTLVFAVGTMAAVYDGPGPAPSSGDGVSEGSGFDDPPPGPIGDGDSLGPNPDAGDGIPDGSSLESPNGPNG
jgi:hypothetical protein